MGWGYGGGARGAKEYWVKVIMLMCSRGSISHVVCGQKTLQMHGFHIQTYEKTLKCHNFNSKV